MKPSSSPKRTLALIRVAIVAFWAVVVAFSVYVFISDPVENDIYVFFIHDESAFHCPSCGMTRATYCLMLLDFAGALYYHAFFTVAFPITAYCLICLTTYLWAGKRVLPYPKNYRAILWVLFSMWMIFTVIRNFIDCLY